MIRFKPSRFGESKIPFVLCFLVALVIHLGAFFYIRSANTTSAVLQLSNSVVDMSEGASAKQETVYFVDLDDIIPEEKHEEAAVKEPDPVKADLKTPPEKKKKPEPKKVKPVEKKQPKPKPEQVKAHKPQANQEPSPQPKTETKEQGNQDGNSAKGSETGANGKATKAEGKSGEGADKASSSGATHLGSYLNNPKPPYPEESLMNGEEGTVTLRAVVETTGRASSVEIVQSSGYIKLDRSALNTVRKLYTFIPAKRNGEPITSVYTFKIEFKIRN